MQFAIYSRGAIEAVPPHDVPHVIISITTTEGDLARLPTCDQCRGVLRLVFADVEEPRNGVVVFGLEHARAVWEFVDQHRTEIERVVVHCDAGLSRSPAVAAAISRCLDGDDAEFFARYRPNMRVYRTLLEVWEERAEAQLPT